MQSNLTIHLPKISSKQRRPLRRSKVNHLKPLRLVGVFTVYLIALPVTAILLISGGLASPTSTRPQPSTVGREPRALA